MTHKLSAATLSLDDIWPTAGETDLVYQHVPVRFRILPRGSAWEVFRDKAFWGIFSSCAEANDSVRTAMVDIFAGGGAAQLRFT